VKREISFALNKNKLFLPIHLEDVSLPPGLELSLGNVQWVIKWKTSDDDYARKIMDAIPGSCLGKSETCFPIPDGFVFIKGGTYLMGSPEFKHQVKVSDFYMAIYPVTVAQFETFINESNYHIGLGSGGDWRCDPYGRLQLDKQHPVIFVSWNDASAYCQWLSQKHHHAIRLPTEAEWEYACRAGTSTPFNTGANLTTDQANYNGNCPYQNFPKGKYIGKTTPVGSYPSNGWGLYDLHGNVMEWCLDWYGEKYYDECKQEGIVENPQGPGNSFYRVLRGGSWDYPAAIAVQMPATAIPRKYVMAISASA
jgi:formylglycine-generating enzyme required for sulfatase activity